MEFSRVTIQLKKISKNDFLNAPPMIHDLLPETAHDVERSVASGIVASGMEKNASEFAEENRKTRQYRRKSISTRTKQRTGTVQTPGWHPGRTIRRRGVSCGIMCRLPEPSTPAKKSKTVRRETGAHANTHRDGHKQQRVHTRAPYEAY